MSYQRFGRRNQINRRGFGGARASYPRYANHKGSSSSGRHGKTFDPSLLVNKAIEVETSVYRPVNSFSDFGLSSQILRNISSKGYLETTAIQDQAIGPIMEGRDLIGIANTGTGKTAAFLVPMIEKVSKNRGQKVFIVAPTRELALQINDELKIFAGGMGIYSALVIGGANIKTQIYNLSRNPNFVIGTPGRVRDLIERRCLDLSKFQNVILDEVDLMVDIGFLRDVKYFISLLSPVRQSLFFSATISREVEDIILSFVKDPVTVSVKTRDTAELVEQDVVKVKDRSRKVEELHNLLIKDGFDKVLVFGRTKWGVEKLTNELLRRGFKAAAIHGNKSQGARQRAIRAFKEAQIQVLLATDVASRGLDIEDVTHVINYDLPETYDDYVHRIGRTGRANKKGIALTFV